jgi:hypothetical protein
MADTYATLANAEALYGSQSPSKVSPAVRSATAGIGLVEALSEGATARERTVLDVLVRDYRQALSEARSTL